MEQIKSKEERLAIEPLFAGWNDTLIWSYLQGYMGEAWVSQKEDIRAAQIIVGDFCFLAGDSNGEDAKALVHHIPENYRTPWMLMVPRNKQWAKVIEEVYGKYCNGFMRYAIKKEPNVFNKELLQSYVERVTSPYEIKWIDEHIYNEVKGQDWCSDFCSQFESYEHYKRQGLGVVALCHGQVIAGASSYTRYAEGIEIEIQTKEAYRRQGLALACAAKLILGCLERHLYPSWDAANMESVRLAEKLGYHFEKEYVTYEINIEALRKAHLL